jgi:phosphoglycerate dehydrogenase-like enzyme
MASTMTSTTLTAASTTRPKIIVLDDAERALRRLADWNSIDARADVTVHHAPLYGEALITALRDADCVVLMRDRTPFDEALIAQLPKLRYVVFTGTRNNALDTDALAARDIPVSHTDWGPSKDSTCEWTWTLILAAQKKFREQAQILEDGIWRDDQDLPLPALLHGQRLGLIGLGEIGGRMARVGNAFGMDVVTWSPRMTDERAAEKGARFVSLDELLSTSYVVSLHLVASANTRHLLNAERLALMREDSLLVNTSRAVLIDTPALIQALAQHRPGFVALDVFDAEPLPHDDPLRKLSHALLTPHMGFVSEPVFRRFATGVTECLNAWLSDQPVVRPLKALSSV